MRVIMAVRKDILNNVIIENRADPVSHPYYIALNIQKRNPVSNKYFRKTRVVNLYNNKIWNRCVWHGSSSTI